MPGKAGADIREEKEKGGHRLWDAVYPMGMTSPKGSKTRVKCLGWEREEERKNE